MFTENQLSPNGRCSELTIVGTCPACVLNLIMQYNYKVSTESSPWDRMRPCSPTHSRHSRQEPPAHVPAAEALTQEYTCTYLRLPGPQSSTTSPFSLKSVKALLGLKCTSFVSFSLLPRFKLPMKEHELVGAFGVRWAALN